MGLKKLGGIGILSLLVLTGCATVQTGPKYPDLAADGSSVDGLKYITTKVVQKCGENWGIAVDLHAHPQREDYLVASYWSFEVRNNEPIFAGPLVVSVQDGMETYAWIVKQDGSRELLSVEEVRNRFKNACDLVQAPKQQT